MNTVKNRWAKLLAGTVILLFAGIIYSWSVFKPELKSTFGWSDASLSLNFTLTMCFFCIGGLVSGLLSKWMSPFVRMAISGFLVGMGFIIAAMIPLESSPLLLYVSYGLMAGTGIGIVYNVVIANVNAWFPDKKGLSSGMLMMGFGFTTLLLGNIAKILFEVDTIGWRRTFVLLGVVIGVVIVLGGLFMQPPSSDTELPEAKKKSGGNAVKAEDYTTISMLKRPSFWLLFVFFIFFASVGSTAIGQGSDYLKNVGISGESLIVWLVSGITVCNGIGRIVSGTIFDTLGLRKTQYITSGVVILATALSLLGSVTGISAIGIAGIFLCGFSYGFSPTLSAAFSGAFYGTKHFGTNFSVLNLILIPASFIQTFAIKLFGTNFTPIFILLIALSVVGLVINLCIKKA